MSISMLIILLLFSIFFFFLLINIRWCINTLRDIAREGRGYTKLVQLWVLFLLSSIFLVIVGYYLIKPGNVDRIDIILTVIVGWLGAIIGSFFGEGAMDRLEGERNDYARKMNTVIDQSTNFIKKAEDEIKYARDKIKRQLNKK